MEKEKVEKIEYAGIFLDKESSEKLKSLIPDWLKCQPRYREIKNEHVTIFFHTDMPESMVEYAEKSEGKPHSIEIDGIGLSNKVIAVRVKSCRNDVNGEETPSTNKRRHITLTVFNNGRPVMSNLIDTWFSIPPISLSGYGKIVYKYGV